jgi:hypothetical protein
MTLVTHRARVTDAFERVFTAPMDRPAENFDLDAEPTEGTDDEEQGQ